MNEDITHGQKLSSAALISCVNKCANTRFVRTILCWDCFYFLKLLGKWEGLLNKHTSSCNWNPSGKKRLQGFCSAVSHRMLMYSGAACEWHYMRNPRDLSTEQMVFLQLWCDGHSFLLIQAYVGSSDKNIDKMASAIGFLLQCYLLPILLVIPSSWVPACWSYFLLESMWPQQGVFSPVLAANWIRFG